MNNDKSIIVTSTAFENEGIIPAKYTGYGDDLSPDLTLSSINENAKSIAIIMDDVDHPIKANFNHWLIWNIPVSQNIPENIPHGKTVPSLNGAFQGRGYGKHRYRGPKPPFNWSHRYQFNVYVLDSMLDLDNSSRKNDLLQAMEGHILQQGFLIGRYR